MKFLAGRFEVERARLRDPENNEGEGMKIDGVR